MQPGINALISRRFNLLKGAKVGLCTNITSCDDQLDPTIALFSQQKVFSLKVVFAPEHGFFGALQDQVKTATYFDKRFNLLFCSLYGKSLVPNNSIFEKIDVLVIDLQDVGTRYYTFMWSAILLLKQAAHLGKPVIILDRPNPLNGKTVQGPVLDSHYISFVGLYPVPVRHGMTIAELCSMVNQELELGADLKIVTMKDWKRDQYYDQTGLCWSMPSPNMPTLNTALVYPGMCLLEGTSVSEGRGTTRPFEIFGAPWIEPFDLVKKLRHQRIRGVEFRPTYFCPTFNLYAGKICGGAQVYVKSRIGYEPFSLGLEIIRIIKNMYPKKFQWLGPPYEFEKKKKPFDILVGNAWIRKEMNKNVQIPKIRLQWKPELEYFKKIRRRYLIYG